MIEMEALLLPDATGENPWTLHPRRWVFNAETPSAKELALLEKLRAVMTEIYDVSGPDCVKQVFDWVLGELRTRDPVKAARAMIGARDTFAMLIEKGYAHECYRRIFAEGCEKAGELVRGELVWRYLTGALPEGEAVEMFVGWGWDGKGLETGDWPDEAMKGRAARMRERLKN